VSDQSSRTASLVSGVIALLIGLLWIGQGLGYLPGSFMTGAMTWFWVGLVLAVLGLLLVLRALRRRPPPPR
jgi:predicted Na+-dependent transporter